MSLPPSNHRSLLLMSVASVLVAASCGGEPTPDEAEPVGSTYESFDAWKAKLPRDPSDGAYLFEGDVGVFDEATLKRLHAEHDQPNALIVNKRDDGSDDRWSDAQKMNLTYCVSPSFGDAHGAVVAAMESAASDWERSAAVRFVHRSEEDESCTRENSNVVFEVMPAYGASYNARSFFPSMAERGKHVLFVDLDNVARARPKSLTGVLRHELGHVLGFRHEHARPQSNGVCTEGPDWRALTPYDPESVMHYNAESPCAGANGGDYELTSLDRAGVAALYGRPGQGQGQGS